MKDWLAYLLWAKGTDDLCSQESVAIFAGWSAVMMLTFEFEHFVSSCSFNASKARC